MTRPVESVSTRLLAVERQVRKLHEAIPDALKLRIDNALLTSTVSRLIGENERLRENLLKERHAT